MIRIVSQRTRVGVGTKSEDLYEKFKKCTDLTFKGFKNTRRRENHYLRLKFNKNVK